MQDGVIDEGVVGLQLDLDALDGRDLPGEVQAYVVRTVRLHERGNPDRQREVRDAQLPAPGLLDVRVARLLGVELEHQLDVKINHRSQHCLIILIRDFNLWFRYVINMNISHTERHNIQVNKLTWYVIGVELWKKQVQAIIKERHKSFFCDLIRQTYWNF